MAAAALLFVSFGVSNWSRAEAAVYYVSNEGADSRSGETPDAAWRTLSRVNTASLVPGDSVLFRRGERWRGQLIPRSGSEKGCVTYGAYGSGAKPLLLGSVQKSDPADWRHEGGNVWVTPGQGTRDPESLGRIALSEDSGPWHLHVEGNAAAQGSKDTSDHDSPPSSYRIHCTKSGERRTEIQLYTESFDITIDRIYQLVFRAKSAKPFKLIPPVLMQSGAPWSEYSSYPQAGKRRVGTTWSTYTYYYKAGLTAEDARLTLYLGSVLPEGTTFYIDSLRLAECARGGALLCDVGNIIFDGGVACGVKVWNESDLSAQGDYWYDEENFAVKLYSTVNPGSRYSEVECALTTHIVEQSGASYVTYENLALKYGGAHGIGGANTRHITVRDCDLAFIGGGDQYGGDRTVRYGNGIEFWAGAHDNLVERCRLWEIYDAALTNQNNGANVKQYNIRYRYNAIWNCEYSFEYWNRPENSSTHDIYFENNTCVNAGHGWGHTQRSDPSGRHLCFYSSTAAARDVYIRNNIFFEAKSNAFYAPGWPAAAIAALRIDNNCWYQREGDMIYLEERTYTMARFPAYQSAHGKEPNSITGDPLFADSENLDFHLTEHSPCIDAGADAGLKADMEGNAVSQGAAPDIGAFEFGGK